MLLFANRYVKLKRYAVINLVKFINALILIKNIFYILLDSRKPKLLAYQETCKSVFLDSSKA